MGKAHTVIVLLLAASLLLLACTAAPQALVPAPIPTPTSTPLPTPTPDSTPTNKAAETPSQAETAEPSQIPPPASTPTPTPGSTPIPTPSDEEYERAYPEIVRGFWMPALVGRRGKQAHSVGEPETIKEFHANLAAFSAPLYYNLEGEIDLSRFEKMLPQVRSLIKEYHLNNISVFLTIGPKMGEGAPGLIPESVSRNDEFASGYDRCLEKLVALAEEEKVEYFAPMNEPDRKLGSEIADVWSRRMLQIAQEGFTGKIVYKGAIDTKEEKPDFSGYAYVGFSDSPWDSNMDNYRQSVRETLQTFLEWSREDKFEPMITEFGIWGGGDSIPEEKKAEAISIVFEEGRKNGIKMFIVFDSPAGSHTQVKGTALEQTVKEHFLWLEQNESES